MLRGLTEFEIPAAVAKSDFRAVISSEYCSGCADCLDRCPVTALSLDDGVCTLDVGRCIGCGLCVSACSTKSLSMERRPEGEVPVPPQDMKGWMQERALKRDLSVSTDS